MQLMRYQLVRFQVQLELLQMYIQMLKNTSNKNLEMFQKLLRKFETSEENFNILEISDAVSKNLEISRKFSKNLEISRQFSKNLGQSRNSSKGASRKFSKHLRNPQRNSKGATKISPSSKKIGAMVLRG